MYQAVSAHAAAIDKVFLSTLGVSSGSCAVTEETLIGPQHVPSRGDSRFRGHHSADQKDPWQPAQSLARDPASMRRTPKISPTDEKVL